MYILGIDPLKVTDDANDPEQTLGALGCDHEGNVYIYLEADGTIDASDCVIIHEDYGTEAITTTLAAAGTGQGKRVAVSPPSTRSQDIAVGDFYWGQVLGKAAGGVNVAASTAKFTQLYTSATAGTLDDSFVSAGKVLGIVTTTTATGTGAQAEVCVINWPHLASDVDTTT